MKPNLRLILSMTLSLCLSMAAQGASLEEAKALYAKRDYDKTNVQNAIKAVEMAEGLSEQSHDVLLFISNAQIFIGDATKRNKNKRPIYEKGWAVADRVLADFEINPDELRPSKFKELVQKLKADYPNDLETIAEALYLHGSNLASWMSITAHKATSAAPKLFRVLGLISELGFERIKNFAVLRIEGAARFKLPAPFQDVAKAKSYLEKAFKGSRHPKYGISRAGNTNVFYAEGLHNMVKCLQKPDSCSEPLKKVAEASGGLDVLIEARRALLNRYVNCISDDQLVDLDPDRIPENRKQREEAIKKMKSWKVQDTGADTCKEGGNS